MSGWVPGTPNDRAFRAVLRSACATGLDDVNLAVAALEEVVATDPEATGPAIKAANLLLVRGYPVESGPRPSDVTRAFSLAIKARDMRRRWSGDSVGES